MAFNSKTLSLCFFLGLLLNGSICWSSELTLAEQKEKSLEERFRRLLAFSSTGDLQARQSYSDELKKAKQAWDLQRLAIGKPIYKFKEQGLKRPIAQNELDSPSIDLISNIEVFDLGQMIKTNSPSPWIIEKAKALESLISIPSKKDYILSSNRMISLSPPEHLKKWKLWQYLKENEQWKLLRTGSGSSKVEWISEFGKTNTYSFTAPLQHPSKIKHLHSTKVELDLSPSKFISASWVPHQDGGIQLSWRFLNKNFAVNEVIILLEHQRTERSKILIQQNQNGMLLVEPQMARWCKSVSFLVYDQAGNKTQSHFKIKH